MLRNATLGNRFQKPGVFGILVRDVEGTCGGVER